MDILVAVDSFKGSATSHEINSKIKKGLESCGDIRVQTLAISDGGEGTLEVLKEGLGGEVVTVQTFDALMNSIESEYLLTKFDGKQTIIIEAASCIGLDLNEPSIDNFINGTSYGLGVMLKEALKQNVPQIIVTLGGTGTADGGLGVLEALGYDIFTDNLNGNQLMGFTEIKKTNRVIDCSDTSIIIASDVTATMLDTENSFVQFNKQKGSNLEVDKILAEKAKLLVHNYLSEFDIDVEKIEGSGAAGGIGSALSIVGGRVVSGFEMISKILGIEEKIKNVDWIITGEGRLDGQSQHGKVPYAIGQLANMYNKKVIALCGSYEMDSIELFNHFTGVFSVQSGPISLIQAMEKETVLKNLENISKSIGKIIAMSSDNTYG